MILLQGAMILIPLLLSLPIASLMAFSSQSAFCNRFDSRKVLPVPDKPYSRELLVSGVKSIAFSDTSEVIYPSHRNFIVSQDISKIPPLDKPFTYTKKIVSDYLGSNRLWLIWKIQKGYLLLDGEGLGVHFFSKDFQHVSFFTIWYDKILPPRDRGGEAPEFEIRDFRARFLKKFNKAGKNKLTGLVKGPSDWKGLEDGDYFLASTVEDFPLLLLRCLKENPGQCFIKRGCFTEGVRTNPKNITGLAVDGKSRLMLLADSEHNRIEVLKFFSCSHVVSRALLHLPARLKKVAAITISPDRSLFVATRFRDDYYNASLFQWDKEQWLP